MENIFNRTVAIFAVHGLALFGQSSIPNTQDVQQLRGATAISSYSISDLETINTTSGNVLFHLPIVSLPRGRAGQSAGVSLIYNSAVYDLTVGADNGQQSGLCQAAYDLFPSEAGGWQLGVGYGISFAQRPTAACQAPSQQASCVSEGGPGEYQWRFALIFPDGSSHTLAPLGYQNGVDGYWPVDGDGATWICTPATATTPSLLSRGGTHSMAFYTTDGTFARVQLTPGASGSSFALFFADGRKVSYVTNPWNTGSLVIDTPPALPDGTQAISGGQQFVATGGNGVYHWTLDSGVLPPGLSLSSGSVSGVATLQAASLVGQPTAAGTYTFTLRVTDTAQHTITRAFTMTIRALNSVAFNQASRALVGIEAVNANISEVLRATGGSGQYTWTATSTLPPGVQLSTGGVLSGTVTQTGTYPFTLQLSDGVTTIQGTYLMLVINPIVNQQLMTDRNANNVSIQSAFDPTSASYVTSVADDVGRKITVGGDWTITATAGGSSNPPLTWTISRASLQSTLQYYRYNNVPQGTLRSLFPLTVVTQVQLPNALGGGTYQFDYNGTPQSAFTSTTSST